MKLIDFIEQMDLNSKSELGRATLLFLVIKKPNVAFLQCQIFQG